MSVKISKQILLLFLILFSNSVIFSQTLITGKVCVDSVDLELPGASVVEMNTSNGTTTDIDGDFVLNVKDSSFIQFSFVGCYDTILPANKLDNAVIILRSRELGEIFTDPHYERTLNIGYYGDVNYLPYGINFYTFQPNLFMMFGSLYYKTNFESDYDLKITFTKSQLIKRNNYKLNIHGEYHKRNFNLSKLNYQAIDYQVSFGNITEIIGFAPGLIYREEKITEFEYRLGYYLSIYKGFHNIGQTISASYTYFGDYSEYRLAIFQKLSNYNWFFSRFQIGLIYNNFREYDDFSILLRYKISY